MTLKSGLGSLFSSLPISSRETYFKIADELDRLKQFENNINSAPDVKTKDDLAKKFDGDYPVVLNENKVARFVQQTPNTNPIEFARRERANASDVFQNIVSFENKQFLDGYQKVFSMMESFARRSCRSSLIISLVHSLTTTSPNLKLSRL
jgi:hypothetical protein